MSNAHHGRDVVVQPSSSESFDLLYRETYDRLVSLCRRYLGRTADVEGVAQEAFLRAWASRDSFDNDLPFWPWLAAIARRICINETIATERHNRRVSAVARRVVRHPTVDDELDEMLHSEAVERALARLTPRQRREIVLCHVEGWSYEEIAALQGVSLESVRASLKRARAVFRSAFDRSSAAFAGALVLGGRLAASLRDRLARSRSAGEWAALAGHRLVAPETVAFVALLLTPGAAMPSAVHHDPGRAVHDRGTTATTAATDAVGQSAPAMSTVSDTSDAAPPAATAAESGGSDGSATPADPFGYRFTVSPSYEEDRTIFAAGTTNRGCVIQATVCPALFRSRDGGVTWTRLRAQGLDRLTSVLLPPGYPHDNRIFAVSTATLSVSADGGATFTPVVPINGAAAISPLFSAGDPRILVGANTFGSSVPVAMEYRDDERTLRPLSLPLPTNVAPRAFSFSPRYASDRAMLVPSVEHMAPASVLAGPENVRSKAALWSCEPSGCRRALDRFAGEQLPEVLWPRAGQGRTVVVWTTGDLHRSTDGGRTFVRASRPVADADAIVSRLVALGETRLFAIVTSVGSRAVSPTLYASGDGGDTWEAVYEFEGSAVADITALPDGALLVSRLTLQGGVVQCSIDGGVTWTGRCGRDDQPMRSEQ